MTLPPGKHAAQWAVPYPAVAASAGTKSGGQQQQPTHEHPVQVPVRVVNPADLPGSAGGGGKGGGGGGGGGGGNLRLKLDLDLDVEVTLKASLRGTVSLSLL